MSVPFSASQYALRIEFSKPVRIILQLVALWGIAALLWSLFAQVPVIVSSTLMEVDRAGVVSAEFPPDSGIQVEQLAYIQLVGQQTEALEAIVLTIDNHGVATLGTVLNSDRRLLLKKTTNIEQVQVIVAHRSPMGLLFGG